MRLKHDKESLERKKEAEQDALVNVEETVKEISRRTQELASRSAEAASQKRKLDEALATSQEELAVKRGELGQLTQANEQRLKERGAVWPSRQFGFSWTPVVAKTRAAA